jgi:hypothetical protein
MAHFKNRLFYIAYIATLAAICTISLPLMRIFAGELVILALCITFIIAGLIAWAIVKPKSIAVALGVLFGSQTPFVVVCVITGGLGLYLTWL